MQVTELANEGLKRAYTVTVPAGEIAATRDKRLAALAKDLRLPGFRPGKVPMNLVRQRYGRAVMGEVLEEQVNEATRQVVSDRGLRPALQPKIEVTNFAENADLEFRVDVEVMPEVPMPDFAGIQLERLKAEPSEESVQKALETLATRMGTLEEIAETRPAAKGEVVIADFVGRLQANLLRNGTGAAPGGSGGLPQHWALETPAGLAAEPVAEEAENHRPVQGLRLSGAAEQGGALRLLLEAPDAIAAQGGEEFTLEARWALGAGALPDGTEARIAFLPIADGAAREPVAIAVALPQPGPLAALRATATVPEGIAFLRPALELLLPAGSVDATLRIGPACLFRGAAPAKAEPFPGGSANDMPIEIGGEGFIPGFAEQLEGIAPGETREIEVVFPGGYGSPDVAGKAAEFSVTAKALRRRVPRAVDDELAKAAGAADLEALRAQIRDSLQREYDALARMRLKRALLDALAGQAGFPVPEGMVENEFSQIWQRVEADLKAGRLDEDDKGKDEATLKAEYRAIAERRIRLGLLLSEIGRSNNITVTADELARAMRQEAARYPGQEQAVMEFFRKNAQAADGLRAPIFEEKVVDFMLELAQIAERQVSPEELSAAA